MNRSKSGLFLMEIMFAVLFFSVASAVCLQLFAKAHTLSRDTVVLDRAVNMCQSAAAVLSARGMEEFCSLHEEGRWQEDTYAVPFDGEAASLILYVTETDTDYDLLVTDADSAKEIFSLNLVRQIP